MTTYLPVIILLSLIHFTKSTQCPTSFIGRCGKNWEHANRKCGQCCVDNDCTIRNEECYADLNTDICSTPTPVTLPNHYDEYELSIVHGCGTGKRVSLTFDDGPEQENDATINIINTLNTYNITATFYVSPGSEGESDLKLQGKCELIGQLSESGYEIQSHSWSHTDFTTLSNEEIISELNQVSDFIDSCGGVRPTMFRPPYGELSKEQAEFIASEQGYIIALWNLDSNDWRTPNDLVILNNIGLNISIFNGDSINILMHDKSIYHIIDDIIQIFYDNGYNEFITQSECFAQCDTINQPGHEGTCWDKNGEIFDLLDNNGQNL